MLCCKCDKEVESPYFDKNNAYCPTCWEDYIRRWGHTLLYWSEPIIKKRCQQKSDREIQKEHKEMWPGIHPPRDQ